MKKTAINSIFPVAIASLSVVILQPLAADWQVINTFADAAELNDWRLHNTLAEGNGFIQIVDRPFDEKGGKALAFSAGNVPFSHANLWRALPQPISDLTTVYFEVAIDDVLGDYAFGFKRIAPDQIVVQQADDSVMISQWPNYAAVARMGRGGQDAYNNNGYAEDFGENRIHTWYQYWMVIDHFNLSYQIYLKGGEFAAQTLVANDFIYRVQEFDDLQTMMMIAHPGNSTALFSAEPIYFANIHIDYTGSNLSEPAGGSVAPTWAGYPVSQDGLYADTGDYLGVLYIGNAPFVYSYDLANWMYLPESFVDDQGSWAFVPR